MGKVALAFCASDRARSVLRGPDVVHAKLALAHLNDVRRANRLGIERAAALLGRRKDRVRLAGCPLDAVHAGGEPNRMAAARVYALVEHRVAAFVRVAPLRLAIARVARLVPHRLGGLAKYVPPGRTACVELSAAFDLNLPRLRPPHPVRALRQSERVLGAARGAGPHGLIIHKESTRAVRHNGRPAHCELVELALAAEVEDGAGRVLALNAAPGLAILRHGHPDPHDHTGHFGHSGRRLVAHVHEGRCGLCLVGATEVVEQVHATLGHDLLRRSQLHVADAHVRRVETPPCVRVHVEGGTVRLLSPVRRGERWWGGVEWGEVRGGTVGWGGGRVWLTGGGRRGLNVRRNLLLDFPAEAVAGRGPEDAPGGQAHNLRRGSSQGGESGSGSGSGKFGGSGNAHLLGDIVVATLKPHHPLLAIVTRIAVYPVLRRRRGERGGGIELGRR